MDFLELAKKRYSTRKYAHDPVSDHDLVYILEAGRIAPSAVNFQPWHFLVIRDPQQREKLNECYHREWFRDAPVVIIVLVDHEKSWKRSEGKDHADIDAAIAADHMTLAAAERGLGTCWVCNFDLRKTLELLRLPDNLEPVAFLPLGHPLDRPDTERHAGKRKKPGEVISYDRIPW